MTDVYGPEVGIGTSISVTPNVGIVVIGRNEGSRLSDCLRSLGELISTTIYVDSGSTDGSLAIADRYDVRTVHLDPARPFTAARARNAGLMELLQHSPHLEYVQFLDGDCLLHPGWMAFAEDYIRRHTEIAVVFGRRRERFPDHSVFNAICDREWDGPAGEALECGGDIFARVSALRQVGGYRNELIAGEEPELCVRLREQGFRIWRLDHDMSWHDANILTLKQWWRRTTRCGHAYAEVGLLHRRSRYSIWHRNLARMLFWSLMLPCVGFALFLVHPAFAALFLLYPLQTVRIRHDQQGWLNAILCMVGKFAELQGSAGFVVHRLSRRGGRLIEYK